MPNRPTLFTVAIAGAAVVGAVLVGSSALLASHRSTQTRETTLTTSEVDIYSPGSSIFLPFGDDTIPLGAVAPAAADPATVSAAAAADYSFTDLLTSIQHTVTAADGWFSDAGTEFAAGRYPLALSEELAGFNNLTVGVENDLLLNGYAALTGTGGNAGFDLENPGQPADFATAVSVAQEFFAQAQQDFNAAATGFTSGATSTGLFELGQTSIDSTNGTDAIIIGLFDSLLGLTPAA